MEGGENFSAMAVEVPSTTSGAHILYSFISATAYNFPPSHRELKGPRPIDEEMWNAKKNVCVPLNSDLLS